MPNQASEGLPPGLPRLMIGHRISRLATVALPALMLVAGLALLVPGLAAAAGTPNIALTKSVPRRVLLGEPQTVTLTAENPAAPRGYNLSFRDVLPPHVNYAGGAEVAPKIIKDKETGKTTLIFENVSDLSPKSQYTLSFQVEPEVAFFTAGSEIEDEAGAYISEKARYKPKFSAAGVPIGPEPKSFTGFDTDTGATELTAIQIEKEEPSPEGEILRGVHDNQRVYTLTVRNNEVKPTSAIVVDDWLPAGLEFLGCGGEDNTKEAVATNPGSKQEYPGSGPLKENHAAPENCLVPEIVATEKIDPDGPTNGSEGKLPEAVYTHVRWKLPAGDALPPKGEATIRYLAAIPIRENTLKWAKGEPTKESREQGANLDNNQGPETFDEQSIDNFARVEGLFNEEASKKVSNDFTLHRTAEDLAIQKTVTPETIADGQPSTWKLAIESSEYRYVSGLDVTDQLPNGLCPLGKENYEAAPQSGECHPTGAEPVIHVGKGPAQTIDYTEATEEATGGFHLAFDQTTVPQFAQLGPSSSLTLEFPTLTRVFYQENFVDSKPVLTGDSWENTVHIVGANFPICAPGNPICEGGEPQRISHEKEPGIAVEDDSAASQKAGGVTIDKKVLQSGSPEPVSCEAEDAQHEYVDGIKTEAEPTLSKYRPGDRVCWQLRVNFASNLYAGTPIVSDFLPPDEELEAGSVKPTANNNVTVTKFVEEEGSLEWELGAAVEAGTKVFEYRFATRVGKTAETEPADITGNLMKFTYSNSKGQTFPLRDRAEVEREEPVLTFAKGIYKVNGKATATKAPYPKTQTVSGGDEVTYRLDLANTGTVPTEAIEAWDNLPAGIECSDLVVGSISDGGVCGETAGAARIVWAGLAVGAKATHEPVTYTLKVPADVSPGTVFNNKAGVVHYSSPTNTEEEFVYIPKENISRKFEEENPPNADPLKDEAKITTKAAGLAKELKTKTVQLPGNNEATQATIGEVVEYEITGTVPKLSKVFGSPKIFDKLGERLALETGSVSATFNGEALPSGFSTTETENTPTLKFPAEWANESTTTEAKFVLKFKARVTNVAANSRIGSAAELKNTGEFTYKETATATTTAKKTASKTATIVEPNLLVSKKQNDADKTVDPGQVLTYTVTAEDNNASAGPPVVPVANVSAANDVVVTDHVPLGLSPLLHGSNEVGPKNGAWDPLARTITWKVATILPGAKEELSYEASVDNPATAGSIFTNTVAATTTSMPGEVSGERTATSTPTAPYYKATAAETVTLAGASIEKAVKQPTATVGSSLNYELKLHLPGGITFHDLTVEDELPAGVEFDGPASFECTTGCTEASELTGTALTPAVDPTTGVKTIGWYFAQPAFNAAERIVVISYEAHVLKTERKGGAVAAGDELENTAAGLYNSSDKFPKPPTTVPPKSGFDKETPPAHAETTVVAPHLKLDKAVSGDADNDDFRVVSPGETLTFTVTLENDGTSPAYEAEVTDTNPGAKLTDVQPEKGFAYLPAGWQQGDPLVWTVPGPIAVGQKIEFTYTAKLVPSAELSQGDETENVAENPSYRGETAAERGENPSREYAEYAGEQDKVMLEVELPKITVEKTTAVSDGEGGFLDSAPAEVGKPFKWRAVFTNTATLAGAKSFDVTDLLPRNWTYKTGSAEFHLGSEGAPAQQVEPGTQISQPAVGSEGETLEWPEAFDLAAGESVYLTLEATPSVAATLDPGAGAAHPNTNEVSAAGEDESGAPSHGNGDPEAEEQEPYAGADTAAAILQVPALTVQKTPDGGPGVAGAEDDYRVEVHNGGEAVATPVTVEDVLEPGQTYTAGSAEPEEGGVDFEETAVEAGPGLGQTTIKWKIGSVAAGETVTIKVPVKFGATLPDPTTVSNEATIETPQETEPHSNEGSFSVHREADLRLEKTADPTEIAARNQIEYTLHVENLGPSEAEGVKIVDPVPAGTSFEAGDCPENAGKVECAVGNLAAGADATFHFKVRVAADRTADIVNTAKVESTTKDPNPGNDEAEAVTTVEGEAELTIEKTAPASVLLGSSFEYELKVENKGPSDATGVSAFDALPPQVEFLEAESADGTCTEASGEVECEFGTLVPGGTASATITVKAVGEGEVTNTAKVESPTEGPGSREDEATTIVGPSADLKITKTAPGTVEAGAEMSYDLEVENLGPSDATGVTVTDPLPAGLEYVSGDPACSFDQPSRTVTCAVGNLANGGVAEYEFTVKVGFGSSASTLVNTATVKGDQPDVEPGNDESTAETEVGPAADIAIQKSGPGEVLLGSTFSYELKVTNAGPQAAADVVVTDPLPAEVEALEFTPSQGSCNALPATTVECELGNLAANGEATVQVKVKAVGISNHVVNVATVESPTPDPTTGDHESEVETVIGPAADLGIVKEAPAKVEAGGQITYQLHIVNNGPAQATGVEVSDPLPAGTEFVSASAACSFAAGTVTCELAELDVEQTEDFEIVVKAPFALAGKPVVNTATVSGEQPDPESENDSSTKTTEVGPAADLGIVKTMGKAEVGQPLTYTLAVSNHGPSASSDAVVKDELPAGVGFTSASPSQGSCTEAGGTVSCDLGPLAAGGSAQVTIVVSVPAALANQTLKNSATVSGPEPDPEPGNNESAVEGPVAPQPPAPPAGTPDLRLVKTVDTTTPTVGTPYHYTVTVTNRGSGPAKNVKVIDTLSGPVKILAVESNAGKCTAAGSKIECLLPEVAAGATARVTYTVVAEAEGKLNNVVSATSGNGEVSPADNKAVKGVRAKAAQGSYSLTKTASKQVVKGGRTIGFTITLKNGATALTDAEVCDRLPRSLVFVKAPGASFAAGRACWSRPFVAAHRTLKLHLSARAIEGFKAIRARNVASAKAANGPARQAAATVRIKPVFGGKPGGVTG